MIGWAKVSPKLCRYRVLVLAVVWVLAPLSALAQSEPVASWARELETSEDFRIRTQAALALGASGNAAAVEPLCKALKDTKLAVRAAAAAALGKLRAGGADCLEGHLLIETSTTVKSIALRSLSMVRSAADTSLSLPNQSLDEKSRFYVRIEPVVEIKEKGRQKPLVSLTRQALARALVGIRGVVVAPDTESVGDSLKRLGKWKQARGLLLSPLVRPPIYQNGNLIVTFEVAVFRLSDRALKATIPTKLTQANVPVRDVEAEDELIRAAASQVVQKLSSKLEQLR